MVATIADDAAELHAAYAATRRLLRTRDALAAQRVVVALCRELGANVSTAEAQEPCSVPMDLSLGVGSPLLPLTGDPRVRALLTRYLAPAVLDARKVVEGGRAAERLQQMATTDVLTGVWSRQSLMLAVNHARSGDCVALIDIDHFKSVNDTLGHAAGDSALADFAHHLRRTVRDRDIVGRFGGDEFVVLFGATSLRDACAVLDRLRGSWSASSSVPLTFSAGITSVASSGIEPEQAGHQALMVADALMYESKTAGRDQLTSSTSRAPGRACRPSTPRDCATAAGCPLVPAVDAGTP